ncbi:MAG: hypothetical protein JSV01_07520 [Desulfobacterales bacterium]|nr:MAG: hypothetical protein JSV01_07520 [Desulfobacterales bacterium]
MKKRRGSILGRGVISSQQFFLGVERFFTPLIRDFPISPLIVTSEKIFNAKDSSRRDHNALQFRRKRQGHT